MLSTRTDNFGQAFDIAGDALDISQLEDMSSPGVMSFYKGSFGISGGAEYNISGNTVLVAELGYYYGFSEVFQQEGSVFGDDEKDLSLYQTPVDIEERVYYTPSVRQGQLMLKVSVLF